MKSKLAALARSFRWAGCGVRHCVLHERNFRIHLAAALFVFWLAGALRVEAAGFGLLSLAVGGVLAAEMLNTAVEAAVDLASPGRHPLAKLAKDVSAGAVLVMALASVGVGFAVLWRPEGLLALWRALLAHWQPKVLLVIYLALAAWFVFGFGGEKQTPA